MNPIPVLVIIFTILVFEQALIGDQVAQSVAPFQVHIDTSQEDCGDLAVGCAIGNFVRPIAGGIAVVLNFIIYLGGLATFPLPGAPWWVTGTLQVGLDASLIWCFIALIRGVK